MLGPSGKEKADIGFALLELLRVLTPDPILIDFVGSYEELAGFPNLCVERHRMPLAEEEPCYHTAYCA